MRDKKIWFILCLFAFISTFGITGDIDTQIYKNVLITRELCTTASGSTDTICDKDLYLSGTGTLEYGLDLLKNENGWQFQIMVIINIINLTLLFLCFKWGFLSGFYFVKKKMGKN